MKKSNDRYQLSVLDNKKQRLDAFLADVFSQYSRSVISTLIKEHAVSVNDIIISKPNSKLKKCDKISISIHEPAQTKYWEKQNIELNIIFEDEHIIVLNKPAGLTVHPGAGQPDSTLANGLHFYNENLNKIPRLGIVHRLDKDTSGIMVVAKTIISHTSLVKQLQERSVSRTYHAVVDGNIISGGTISNCIGRDPKKRTAMAVVKVGKDAVTHYRVKNKFKHHTLVEVKLETGRTHQIRVHMAYIKHPIVGDQTYGKKIIRSSSSVTLKNLLSQQKRQALHAKELKFIHPITNNWVDFSAPYPDDFENLLEGLYSEENNE